MQLAPQLANAPGCKAESSGSLLCLLASRQHLGDLAQSAGQATEPRLKINSGNGNVRGSCTPIFDYDLAQSSCPAC